jgi:hypothetical protein
MGSISSSRWNNNSNNLKKVVAIAVMIFILFVISEVANAVQRRKTLALHATIDHDDELSAADSYDVVSNASLFSSLDAELEWDRYMIPGYDYHQNRVNNNNNNNIDEGKGSTNPSSSASKRDTERKLSSHHLRRKQK